MNFKNNLQIEFKHKKHCDKLENTIKKDPVLGKFFDCRLENVIMFKFNSEEFRYKTLMCLRYGLKYSKIKERSTGINYLYVSKL